MSRNPYLKSDGPAIQRSVFVFMDILGYTGMIQEAEASGQQQDFLNKIHKALSEGREWLEEKKLPSELVHSFPKDDYALKAFTDNIVIGWPISGRREDGESELMRAFSTLADFQLVMALEGLFVRGAISIGNAYIDDIAVFGDALTEAHLGETTLARDPRIILTASSVKAVKGHLKYYGQPHFAPQARDLLQDSDGQWFLNYLDTLMFAVNDVGPFYSELEKHKAIVEANLIKYKNRPNIFAKYAWVANYHNVFCDLHSTYFSESHKIDTELYRARPTLIIE